VKGRCWCRRSGRYSCPGRLRPKSSGTTKGQPRLAPVVQQRHDQLLELVAAGLAEEARFRSARRVSKRRQQRVMRRIHPPRQGNRACSNRRARVSGSRIRRPPPSATIAHPSPEDCLWISDGMSCCCRRPLAQPLRSGGQERWRRSRLLWKELLTNRRSACSLATDPERIALQSWCLCC